MRVESITAYPAYKVELDKLVHLPYTGMVMADLPADVTEEVTSVADWVRDNIQKDRVFCYYARSNRRVNAIYAFCNEDDAIAFRLRFSELDDADQ